jgi:hypothetical protein
MMHKYEIPKKQEPYQLLFHPGILYERGTWERSWPAV